VRATRDRIDPDEADGEGSRGTSGGAAG